MLIIGLTGSIGMGKSTTAGFFREAGIPVHDADSAVHDLYDGDAAPLIDKAFPSTMRDSKVDRDALFSHMVSNPAAMKQLEKIIHPLVTQHRNSFMAQAAKNGAKTTVLDVPLLFETGTNKDCDIIIVVSAPFLVQKQRVLARVGMTEARFQAILDKQMPDSQKRQRAHFTIETGRGLLQAKQQVNDVLRCLAPVSGHKYKGLGNA
jgi:dephospho-CoA kinase